MKLSYLLIGLMLLCGIAFADDNTVTAPTADNSDASNLLNLIPGYHLAFWTFQDIYHIGLAIIVVIGIILALVLLTGILKWVGYIVVVYFVLSYISTVIH